MMRSAKLVIALGGLVRVAAAQVVFDCPPDTWDFWWELEQARFVAVREHVQPEPTEEDRVLRTLPALKEVLDGTEQRDIASACLLAMAKIGRDHPRFSLHDVFAARLCSADREIREAAALALGIAVQGDPRSIDLLLDLARDTTAGRRACAAAVVDERTRAFACYGLGLAARAHAGAERERAVFGALRELIGPRSAAGDDVLVAAVTAIGMVPVDAALQREALATLHEFLGRRMGARGEVAQAHAATAIARLLANGPRDDDAARAAKATFAAELRGPARATPQIARSCALALGRLAAPVDDASSADAAIADLLLQTWRTHPDAQTRAFAIVALGRTGGRLVHARLLEAFAAAAGVGWEQSWIAMAMGCHAQGRAAAPGEHATLDAPFGEALLQALHDTKDPQAAGAFALALGLVHHRHAVDDLRERLQRSRIFEDLAGRLCLALGLLGDPAARADVREMHERSSRNPDLARQTTLALRLLGDDTLVEVWTHRLEAPRSVLATTSTACMALGATGERSAIAPLLRVLRDGERTELARAFAAVALGMLGSRQPLPWNAAIGFDLNYRATVPTSSDRMDGVLDLF